MATTAPLQEFREFLERARRISDAAQMSNIERFKSFVETSSKLVVEPVRNDFLQVTSRLASLRALVLPTELDILRVSGLTYSEDPYTELIAWAIDPNVNPTAAQEIQKAWLSRLDIPVPVEQAARPRTQFRTADGIPDLVLEYPEFLVIVEAKTGSDEHVTPRSSRYQTESYPSATRKALKLPESHPTFMVFLTPDRRAPKNDDAIPTTFLEFATCMATALIDLELAGNLRALYSVIITHFASCASADDLKVRELFNWIDQAQASTKNNVMLLQNLSMLRTTIHLLGD